MSKEYKEGDEYKKGKGGIYKLQKHVSTMPYLNGVEPTTGLKYPLSQMYELWEAKNKNKETVLLRIKQPNPKRLSLEDETSNIERLDPVYNEHEVNLLLDSYEEWINNERNPIAVDPMLLKVRLEHIDFLKFLREKSSQYITRQPSKKTDFKKKTYGWRLLYYHRTVPSYMGYKLFDRFCKENPDLWEKMKVDITQWKDEYKQKKKRDSEASHEGLVEG